MTSDFSRPPVQQSVRFGANQNLEGVLELIESMFMARVLEDSRPFVETQAWATEDEKTVGDGWQAKLPPLMASMSTSNGLMRLFTNDDALVLVRYYPKSNRVSVSAAAFTDAAVKAAIAWVKTSLFTELEDTEEDDSIAVRFWTGGMHGPQSFSRRIAAPTFDEVQGNYSALVQEQLTHMTGPNFKPGAGGQLLLWYGPPGTGKTYALRALSQSWREWAEIHYIVDPERFFGDSNYLMPVMLARPDDEREWRLIVLEDTGELLSMDAKERAGQGLSRLLNVVDGFLGQGLKTLVLITTNEKLESLHPAVSRPGRCAVKVNFDALDAKTAQDWAKANGITIEDRDHTLAELFAIRAGTRHDATDKPTTAKRRPIGFGAERPRPRLTPSRIDPSFEEDVA